MSEASKAALERHFVHTLQVTRKGLTDVGGGNFSEAYAPQGSAFLGRVWPLNARERERASREDARVTHKALVPAGTDVVRSDRVTRSGDSAGDFEVISVQEGGELGHHVRLSLFRDERGI